MEQQSANCKVFVVVLCAVLCLLDGKPAKEFRSGYDIFISSGQKHISSSGILFTKVGTSLELNCSTSNNSIEIEWKVLQSIRGTTIRLQNNSVIQYKIDKVTWDLNGTVFWCRPVNVPHQDGVKVTVIVGDLPSPPRDLSSSIYDVKSYIVRLSWKQALYTGRLPAYYKISYHQCYNKTYIPVNPEYQFCRKSHVNGREDYSCEMKRDDMVHLPIKSDPICEIYRVTIVTVNDVGVSNAINLTLNLGYGGESFFMPTPLPPSGLWAESKRRSITVQWKVKYYYALIDPKYIVLYHAEMDTKNKTAEIKGQKMVTLRDDIKAYTTYYIYLLVEVSKGNQKETSKAIGPVTTTTDEGEPKQGPSISEINSIVHENAIRDVTLQWEEPVKSSFQGKPSNITVYYRNTAKQQSTFDKIILPASQTIPRNVTLTGLHSDNDYKAYTMLCNTKHCGGMGPEKMVTSVPYSAVIKEKNTRESGLILGMSLGFVGLLLVILAVVIVIIKYRKNRRLRSLNGSNPLEVQVPLDILCPDPDNYQDIDNRDRDKYTPVVLT